MSARNTAASFWARVNKAGPVMRPDLDACWLWIGGRHDRHGYGAIGWAGRSALAHRVAFQLANGRPPRGICRHRCDNPSCVRPSHLVEGTFADNNHDRDARGRTARGRRLNRGHLDDAAVRAMRERSALGESCAALARAFNTDSSNVSRIVRGRSWRHVQ